MQKDLQEQSQRITAQAKVGSAVDCMASSLHPMRGRLQQAFGYIVSLDPNDVPLDARPAYLEIRRRFTELSAKGDEGRVTATLSRVRNAKLEKLARLIVELNQHLQGIKL